ncbi:hypothetical protein BDF14DRAFT_1748665, partial [Spinellus fusiger]
MGARCKYCKAMGHDVANCPSKPKELCSCFLCHAIEADPSKRQRKTVSTTTDIPKDPLPLTNSLLLLLPRVQVYCHQDWTIPLP